MKIKTLSAVADTMTKVFFGLIGLIIITLPIGYDVEQHRVTTLIIRIVIGSCLLLPLIIKFILREKLSYLQMLSIIVFLLWFYGTFVEKI